MTHVLLDPSRKHTDGWSFSTSPQQRPFRRGEAPFVLLLASAKVNL